MGWGFSLGFFGGRCDMRQGWMGMDCSLCFLDVYFVRVFGLEVGFRTLKIINWWFVLNTLHNELSTSR